MKVISSSPYAPFNSKEWNSLISKNVKFENTPIKIQKKFYRTDRELLKEVTQELWNTVKKLRPEIDRQTRLQLVLKALLTIGDLPDQMQAAMVVGVCAEMDKSDVDNVETNSQTKDSSGVDTSTGRKVVRRSSAK